MMEAGTFREDLYYRLLSARLSVLSLRERREDILPCFRFFLRHASANDGAPSPEISAVSHARLATHDWPGNLRELQRFAQLQMLCPQPLPAAGEAAKMASLASMMEVYETRLIAETLSATGGNATQVMKHLKISRKTLYDKVKKHKLLVDKFRRKG